MDQHRFDDLTRKLAAPASRRALLRSTVVAAAAAFGVRSATQAATSKRGPGEICRKQAECMTGTTCTPDGSGRSRCACNSGTKPLAGSCYEPGTHVSSGRSRPWRKKHFMVRVPFEPRTIGIG